MFVILGRIMELLRLIHLLRTVITVTAINYSCVLCMEESSQGVHGKSLPLHRNTERSASALMEPEIFSKFKIRGFHAKLQPGGILVSWDILKNEKPGIERNSERNMKIFQNGNSVPESDEITTVMIMKEKCVFQVHSTNSAKCDYFHYPIENCINYKFILGNKNNTAQLTTVPIVQGSVIFELTRHEDNPVKLIWKIDCNATDRISPVSVSFVRRTRTISFMVDAVCNSTEKNCEAYLGKAQVLPCVPNTINVNHETALLDVETYYAHASVHSLSVKVENAHIRIEWNEFICQFASESASYTLIVFETDSGQVASNISIPSRCVEGTQRRKFTLKKNSINYCPGSTEGWRLGSVLKSCTNYSVNIVHPKNKNTASLKGSKSPSFVLQSLEPAEIHNLEIAEVSSNAFQVKWENPIGCLKVKDLVIPIKINNQWPMLRLSDTNTECKESTCIVKWEHRTDVSPCTEYFVTVGTATVHVRTRPPGIATVNNIPTNASSDGFSVEWRVPLDCRGWLTTPTEWRSSFLDRPHLTENCNNTSCRMLWQFREKLDPCAAYSVSLGFFSVNFRTLPDVPDGLATNVTVWSEKQSPGDVDTAVVSWKRPVCQTPILGWQILIRRMRSITEVVTNISNLVSRFEFDVKPCEIYLITIRTQYEDGGDRYSTAEKYFESKCPMRFLVPISAIAILLVIAVIIALLFLRMRRRREAVKNQTELNNIRTPSTENRNRISSISCNRLSSFNLNRISSNSRHSSNANAENDLDTLPQMTKRPLTVRDLCSFEIGQARKEFFLINKLTEVEAKRLARTTAEQPENKTKNRFLNTHPYDFNRVVLSHSEERLNDSYINASFIPGFGDRPTENEYIAAQGPKDNTVGDFWRMIWEQKVQLIAMVTSLHECGKKKCEKYWPDKGDSVVYGDFQLELLDERVDSFYTERKMRLSKSPASGREIQQFHFTAWPDFETPGEPEQIIRFIEIVRREARQLNFSSPIVVHCSAGVGRTGTFIALDYLIQQVLVTDVVDVPKTVRHLRRFRLSMVQSEAQYVFLYTCIAHYVKTRLAPTSLW